MGVLSVAPFGLIDVVVIALGFGDAALAHAHRHHGVAALLQKLAADVNVLAGKGLVDEENIHALRVQKARLCQDASAEKAPADIGVRSIRLIFDHG